MARRRFSTLSAAPRLQTPYNNYKQWQDRTEPTHYTRSSASNPGGYLGVAITPFGGLGEGKVLVKCSRRAFTNVANLLGARVSDETATATRMPGFEPAKAVIFRGTGGTTSETSQITRQSYKKRTGNSYTLPFGGATATEKEMDAQAIIATAVLATANSSVTFLPERLFQR